MPVSLCAESLSKHFPTRSGDLVVLRDMSLTLEEGESAVIMGPSGSGKSTLLNILGTLDTPTAGRLTVGNLNPFDLGEKDLARFRNQQIGFVFQDQHLLPQCGVLENVLLATLAGPRAAGVEDRARGLLDRVGLTDRLSHLPSELSGGERQRVAIARALVNSPTLLLADEPTGNLDQTTADGIAALLSEIHRDEGVTLIVVTHSPRLAGQFIRKFDVVEGKLVERKGT